MSDDVDPARPASRRTFLRASVLGAAAMAGSGCSLFVKKRAPDATARVEGGAFRISLADHPALRTPGGSVVVALEGGPEEKLLLFRRPGGDVSALSIECTHLSCDVEYAGGRDRIVCPCHGSEYDPWGRNLKGPADEPLSSYRVAVEGDAIVVTVG